MANITGTNGKDVLNGTPLSDEIYGLSGDDVISGGAGGDAIYGGDGADVLSATTGNDTIDGGHGADIIDAGDGDNLVTGDEGNDTITTGSGADTVSGGDGDDVISTGAGNDSIDGGMGDDHIDAGAGDDILLGGQGNDTLLGLSGDDTINGGLNDDYVEAGEGDDAIILNAGNDTAYGGYGDDTFYVSPGGHQIIGGEDPDGNDIDVLDLSGAGDYEIIYTGPESGIIRFFNPEGHPSRTATFKEIERVICFTPGTGIATMQGEVPVEDLKVGDRVFTRDNGAQEICWIGRKKITLGQGTLSQKLQPILIRKGALGQGLPERDITVSPNHRVLLTNKAAQLLFEDPEVLVAAKHLVGMEGICHLAKAEVEYVHFLCENHQIVLSNGAWTETFQPGDYSLGGLGEGQREELFALFPELRAQSPVQAFNAARRTLKRYEAALLTAG